MVVKTVLTDAVNGYMDTWPVSLSAFGELSLSIDLPRDVGRDIRCDDSTNGVTLSSTSFSDNVNNARTFACCSVSNGVSTVSDAFS